MKITYTNTVDDLVAFNMYHISNSHAYQRKLLYLRFLYPIVILLIFAVASYFHDTIAYMIGGGTFAVFVFFYFPRLARRDTQKLAKKMYAEQSKKNVSREYELEITSSELIESGKNGTHSTKLEAIERIGANEGYTFIYVGPIEAQVIPEHAITSGDYHGFIKELRAKCPQLERSAKVD